LFCPPPFATIDPFKETNPLYGGIPQADPFSVQTRHVQHYMPKIETQPQEDRGEAGDGMSRKSKQVSNTKEQKAKERYARWYQAHRKPTLREQLQLAQEKIRELTEQLAQLQPEHHHGFDVDQSGLDAAYWKSHLDHELASGTAPPPTSIPTSSTTTATGILMS
jgi:hypothetical protein